MTEQNQDKLDRLLQDHLANELDGQIGTAGRKFLHRVASATPRRSMNYPMLAAAAVAALLVGAAAFAVMSIKSHHDLPQVVIQPEPTAPAAATADVSRVFTDQYTDEGTIGMGEGAVARKYRRQIIELTQWYDPQTHVLRQDIRRQSQIVLLGSQTY